MRWKFDPLAKQHKRIHFLARRTPKRNTPMSIKPAHAGSGTDCIAIKHGLLNPPTAYVDTEPPPGPISTIELLSPRLVANRLPALSNAMPCGSYKPLA